MNKKVQYGVFLGVLILILGVGAFYSIERKKEVSKPELLEYLKNKENGVSKLNAIGSFRVGANYKPSELLAHQELRNVPGLDREEVLQKYSKYLYFTLKLSYNDKGLEMALANSPQFNQILQWLSFGISNDISLITENGEKIPVINHSFSRSYGMSPTTNILVVFDKESVAQYKNLTLVLNGTKFGMGEHEFDFNKTDIELVPQLSLEFENYDDTK